MNDMKFSLALLKIPVSDITLCAEFYRDALGFAVEFVVAEYGGAQLLAGDLPIALYKPGAGGGDGHIGGSTGFHLSLPADRFASLAEALRARGALVEDRIHQGDDGTTFIDVRDPGGNILKIFSESEE